MPVVDSLAAEYADRIDFVAPAWHSTFELTEQRAEQLFLSGQIKWGLDEEVEVFDLYGIPYQPVTVLIAGDKTVVESWSGLRAEEDIRAALDDLIALSG
ncbi:MAG: hypothetical protein PVG83_04665 [Acidimicrobiia bacterium]